MEPAVADSVPGVGLSVNAGGGEAGFSGSARGGSAGFVGLSTDGVEGAGVLVALRAAGELVPPSGTVGFAGTGVSSA